MVQSEFSVVSSELQRRDDIVFDTINPAFDLNRASVSH